MNKNEKILNAYEEASHELHIFMDGVAKWFAEHPSLASGDLPIVHSVKSRLKSKSHLLAKIGRKTSTVRKITPENFLREISDLAGVRVLHLYQQQFRFIHDAIIQKTKDKDWALAERPIAYTWDPESASFFKSLAIRVQQKESFYTSVHYIVRPRKDANISCEIQVRTLFEEIWGEIDHAQNYPNKTISLSCSEQLRVLAKVVGAGSRLADSIFRTTSATGK